MVCAQHALYMYASVILMLHFNMWMSLTCTAHSPQGPWFVRIMEQHNISYCNSVIDGLRLWVAATLKPTGEVPLAEVLLSGTSSRHHNGAGGTLKRLCHKSQSAAYLPGPDIE